MDLEDKCSIIEQFSKEFTIGEIDREFFEDFVLYNDLGVPLASLIVYGLADATSEGQGIIDETWQQLCETLDLDPDDEYDDFDEMIDLFEEGISED